MLEMQPGVEVRLKSDAPKRTGSAQKLPTALSGPPQLLGPVGRLIRPRTEWPLRHAAPDQPLNSVARGRKEKPRVHAAGFFFVRKSVPTYLILASLNSTCLRTTGSYFVIDIFSVIVREFFLVT